MFDHVTIGASDREASRRFYATVLGALGRSPSSDPFDVEWGDLSIAQAGDGRPVTTGLHLGFTAPSPGHVDAFWQAGVDAGHRDDGAPGPRPQYRPDYYGAFLLDPDGNSAEAVVHDDARAGGIDHLWVRVRDVAAGRAFYETIAPHAGFGTVTAEDDLVRFRRGPGQGSFTLVAGAPTTPFHLAFDAPDRDTVAAFHAAAIAAGYPDNGGPGERPAYHPGYFGAFVIDPDGHNVEAVHHGER
jgi:catechol 2,3-dioxygenase-like lactoylglutathione lyase family enzyme